MKNIFRLISILIPIGLVLTLLFFGITEIVSISNQSSYYFTNKNSWITIIIFILMFALSLYLLYLKIFTRKGCIKNLFLLEFSLFLGMLFSLILSISCMIIGINGEVTSITIISITFIILFLTSIIEKDKVALILISLIVLTFIIGFIVFYIQSFEVI